MESGCILSTMVEISGKWMKTVVNSEADEKNRCQTEWPDGVARRNDQGGLRYLPGKQDKRTPSWVPNGGWMAARWRQIGARRRVHGCSMESGSGPMEGGVRTRKSHFRYLIGKIS